MCDGIFTRGVHVVLPKLNKFLVTMITFPDLFSSFCTLLSIF